MFKTTCFILFTFLSANLFAQIIVEDDLKNLLKDSTNSNEKKSSLTLSIGAGNGVFSKKNNSLNADQSVLNKIFYTTTADYYNKSGLGLTLNSTFVPENGVMNFYQTALSPSYYYNTKDIYTGISYTHFFTTKNTKIDVNPFKDEVSGSFKWLKSLIRPGIQMVYSNGMSKESFDTSYIVNNPPPPHVVHEVGTVTSKINDFTVSLSADHKFNFERLFFKEDELSFIPSIALNAGSNKNSTKSSTNFSTIRKKKLASTKRSRTGSYNQSFAIQSIAISTDFYYSIDKFFIEPEFYADYYLHTIAHGTNYKRLATIFSLTAVINF